MRVIVVERFTRKNGGNCMSVNLKKQPKLKSHGLFTDYTILLENQEFRHKNDVVREAATLFNAVKDVSQISRVLKRPKMEVTLMLWNKETKKRIDIKSLIKGW